jgi:hypothetical protein
LFRIGRFLRNALAVWGAVSLAALLALLGFLFNVGAFGSWTSGGPRDVGFVLNWAGLGDRRLEKLIHSYESGVHFTGDHFTAYAIKVTSLTASELEPDSEWVRGDRADDILKEAVQFISSARDQAPWLPMEEELQSSNVYVFRFRVELMSNGVTAAQLIFARPSDQMIFYASLQI